MSDCDLIRVHLAARAAGEPLEETEGLVERHLAGCPPCRRENERLEQTAALLREGSVADVPVDGEDAIDWERFRAETVERATRAARPFWRHPGVGVAAAALVLAAGLSSMLRTGPSEEAMLEAIARGVPSPDAPVAGAGAERFVRELERVRSREQTVRLLRSGRNLLVGLAAAPAYCEKDRRDMMVERDVSLRLLRQKQVLDPQLARLDLGRSRSVCDDLERVLRSVATLDDCPDPDEVRTILEVASARGLLPRIDAALQGLAEEGGARA